MLLCRVFDLKFNRIYLAKMIFESLGCLWTIVIAVPVRGIEPRC